MHRYASHRTVGRSAYAGAMIEADKIGSIIPGKFPALGIRQATETPEVGEKTFSELLADGIGRVQDLAEESDQLSLDMALGRPVELHQAMIAATKAQIALELLIQVRNKIIEAYQQISSMPV
jgi:flagellar hook-basal body complex protein FliE